MALKGYLGLVVCQRKVHGSGLALADPHDLAADWSIISYMSLAICMSIVPIPSKLSNGQLGR
jgi:hypothetical protein